MKHLVLALFFAILSLNLLAVVPNAPSNLVATTVSYSRIDLTWNDNSNNELGFGIARKTGSGGTYEVIATVGANVTSFQNTGLDSHTTYYYYVGAYNASGASNPSNEAHATTLYGPPIAPSNLSVTVITSSQINLSWTDNSNFETGEKIERKTGSTGTWAEIATVAANVTAYNNTSLSQHTTYYYRVRAYYSTYNSAYSNEANATTELAAPSALTATAVSASQINLSWTDNSNDEEGFGIARKTGAGGTYELIATVGANVTIFDNTGLSQNTTYYYYVVAFIGTTVISDPSSEASAHTFYATPAAPSDLITTAISASQINLAWTDNSINETGFKIERKTGAGGTWSEIATTAANVTTYSNTSLAECTTYYYRVRAYNVTVNSAYSNEASATTKPVAPTNLSATAVSSSQINLVWTDNSYNEEGYRIARKIGAGGTWEVLTSVSANVHSYQNTGLNQNTTYYYVVAAYYGTSISDPSNEASATTPYATPAAPSNLSATAISASQISLAWTDNSSTETGFKIERKIGAGGTWSELVTTAANTVTYSSTGLSQNTTYYYRVRAVNVNVYSDYTNEAYATTPYATPASPSNLSASTISASQINLAWTDNSSDETGFKIERKTGVGGTWSQIATVTANVTTYNNTSLSQHTTYYYRVRAYNVSVNSAYSNEAYATTELAPPSNLTATAVSSSQINLSWTDNSNDEEGFGITRKTGAGGTYTIIATVGANVTSYSDTGLSQNTTYYYYVGAFIGTMVISDPSNEASATTFYATPSTPSDLIATSISSSQINLAWTDNSSNETGFQIERKTGADGTWSEIATTAANVTTYSNTSLAECHTYYYRVRAHNVTVNSSYSNEASATTKPVAPTNLTATALSSSQINLVWSDNSYNEEGYRIARKIGAGGSWAVLTSVSANIHTYHDTDLNQHTTYYYAVAAYYGTSISDPSNEAYATTPYATPAAPGNLTATAVTLNQANLAWTDNSNNETGFRIERKIGTGDSWSEIASLTANVTAYYDMGLIPNTYYWYRVRAVNGNIYSSYSNEANITTGIDTQPQDWQWAERLNTSAQSLSTDSNGNVYVTGRYWSTATFGNFTLTGSGFYVAKLDPNNNWVWATSAPYTEPQYNITYISTDANGNSYITGKFITSVTFGTTTLTSTGSTDIFVAKIDSGGNWLWAQRAGNTNEDYSSGISIDNVGNCYIIGYCLGSSGFGDLTYSAGHFVAKMNTNGNWIWIQGCISSDDMYNSISDISTDSTGNCYITGRYKVSADFGNTILTSYGYNQDIFVAKLDANGNWLWAKSAGADHDDKGIGISLDNDGNCYVTGSFYCICLFGTMWIGTNWYPMDDVFVAKLDTNGNWLWAVRAGGDRYDYGTSIVTSGNGTCVVTGTINCGYQSGDIEFGSSVVTGIGGDDIFVAMLDTNGNWLWVKIAGGYDVDYSYDVVIGTGQIPGEIFTYVVCRSGDGLEDTATFGSISFDGGAYFIAKLGLPMGVPQSDTMIFDGTSVQITWSAVPGANSYYVYRSTDPYATNWGTPIAQVAGPTYFGDITAAKYFYRVTASTDIYTGRIFEPESPEITPIDTPLPSLKPASSSRSKVEE